MIDRALRLCFLDRWRSLCVCVRVRVCRAGIGPSPVLIQLIL
jgi:hypothetical protein